MLLGSPMNHSRMLCDDADASFIYLIHVFDDVSRIVVDIILVMLRVCYGITGPFWPMHRIKHASFP